MDKLFIAIFVLGLMVAPILKNPEIPARMFNRFIDGFSESILPGAIKSPRAISEGLSNNSLRGDSVILKQLLNIPETSVSENHFLKNCTSIEWRDTARSIIKDPLWQTSTGETPQIEGRLEHAIQAGLESTFSARFLEFGPISVNASAYSKEISVNIDTPCGLSSFNIYETDAGVIEVTPAKLAQKYANRTRNRFIGTWVGHGKQEFDDGKKFELYCSDTFSEEGSGDSKCYVEFSKGDAVDSVLGIEVVQSFQWKIKSDERLLFYWTVKSIEVEFVKLGVDNVLAALQNDPGRLEKWENDLEEILAEESQPDEIIFATDNTIILDDQDGLSYTYTRVK